MTFDFDFVAFFHELFGCFLFLIVRMFFVFVKICEF